MVLMSIVNLEYGVQVNAVPFCDDTCYNDLRLFWPGPFWRGSQCCRAECSQLCLGCCLEWCACLHLLLCSYTEGFPKVQIRPLPRPCLLPVGCWSSQGLVSILQKQLRMGFVAHSASGHPQNGCIIFSDPICSMVRNLQGR